jgi:ParB/RepB/Spo0J family partition protein
MPEMMIPLDKINMPQWNSRLSTDGEELKLAELANSMRADGQMNAINVEGPLPDGTYDLVAGSRRYRAAQLLDMKTIRANVEPPTDPGTRIMKNIVENEQRQDLTLYEQARAYATLRSPSGGKVPLKVVAEKTGKSEQHISNLATMFHKLPAIVKTDWEKSHPAANFKFLHSLSQIKADTPEATAEKQVLAWKERVEMYEDFDKVIAKSESADSEDGAESDADSDDSDGAKKTKKKRGENGTFKVANVLANDLALAIKKSSPPGAALALSVIRFLRGEVERIKGVYPPKED